VDLSLQLTAFLVSKLFCKKVEIAIYILDSSLLNNQYSFIGIIQVWEITT
jgi:hypothetical protein